MMDSFGEGWTIGDEAAVWVGNSAAASGENDNIDIIPAMRLHLLVLDGVFDLGLAALTDTLSTANELSTMLPDAPAPIEMTLVGVRRRVRTAQGLTVPVLPAITMPRPDVVLVPALGAKMPQALAARLVRPDVRDATDVLQRWARAEASAGAACTGTFLLAESSLLDGHHATPRGGWHRCFASAIRRSRSTNRACSSIRPASRPRVRRWPISTWH
jgi:transcriptional regulator GlxA family with amidase domain